MLWFQQLLWLQQLENLLLVRVLGLALVMPRLLQLKDYRWQVLVLLLALLQLKDYRWQVLVLLLALLQLKDYRWQVLVLLLALLHHGLLLVIWLRNLAARRLKMHGVVQIVPTWELKLVAQYKMHTKELVNLGQRKF